MQYPAMARRTQLTRFLVSLYATPARPNRDAFYTVVRAGHLQAGPEHRIERENYPGHELIWCRSGKGVVRVEGREVAVGPGSVAWINCHHPHAYWADPDDPWEVFWIRVEGPQLDRICTILSAQRWPVIEALAPRPMERLFQRIFKQMQSRQADAPAWIHAIVADLFARLFHARLRTGNLHPSEPVAPLSLRKPLERMELYYHRPLRVAELAALGGMSVSHFMRLFKEFMGTSPIDWLRRERINQAKCRLLESDDSIKEIARQVGYGDQFFFSKDFKQITGFTPTDFRRQERGTN